MSSFKPDNVPQTRRVRALIFRTHLQSVDQPVSSPGRRQYHVQQYSDAPQGDPFAEPPVIPFFPPFPAASVPPPKPAKKKRRPRREPECGFCEGNDKRNKQGKPELMHTCSECGRSGMFRLTLEGQLPNCLLGHATCMQLADADDQSMRSYDWKCTECKTCDVCELKGDDVRTAHFSLA